MFSRLELPEDPKDFIKMFEFKDHACHYTNGSYLIPSYRVLQMIEHYFNKETKGEQ